MKPDYCIQNDGDCKTCSLVNYGRDCQNNIVGKVTPISMEDWLKSWLIDSFEICSGCGSEIYFRDTAYEHSQYDGSFCHACYEEFESGNIPVLLK
jgi:hypothetical protein